MAPAPIHVAQLLAHPAVRSAIERALAARGVRGDTAIVHVDPREEALLRFMGGVGTVNPRTGLRQFYVGGDPGSGANTGGSVSGDGGAIGGGSSLGGGVGTNPGGYGDNPFGGGGGFFSGGVLGAIGSALGSLGSNFGRGWASQGVAGGYGQAAGPGGSITDRASGLGASGGGSGQNYYSQNYYSQRPSAVPAGSGVAAPVAPINNMPPAQPVALTPMMSSTATTDLTGGRFGALPSWATTPYQVGMAPSSYPTPGVNAALGAPGAGGGGLPGGGGGLPGGGGGLPGGGGGLPGTGANTPAGALGVSVVPGGTVILPGGGAVGLQNGPQGYPVLPNGQTLSQYLTSLKLGLTPKMPAGSVGYPQSGPQAAAPAPQPALQPAPRIAPQIVPQQAPTQPVYSAPILGGTPAQTLQQLLARKPASLVSSIRPRNL